MLCRNPRAAPASALGALTARASPADAPTLPAPQTRAGNPHGWVFAFDAASGARLAGLAPYRAPAYPVRGCGVSEDCR